MLGSTEKYKKRHQFLLKLIKKLKIDNKIKVIPSAPYKELGNYIAAANCVVIPSIAEGFGYNAVEAATMGIPAVVSNAGSLPEVISGKHLLFESKDVKDLAEKVMMVSKGQYTDDKVREYKWGPGVKRYLDVYGELIADNIKK